MDRVNMINLIAIALIYSFRMMKKIENYFTEEPVGENMWEKLGNKITPFKTQ